MKSSLYGPLVLLVFSGMIASGTKYYITFSFGLTWEDAQNFCKKYYIDLATINTWSDLERMDLKHYLVWIGLQKHYWFQNWYWKWSDGRIYDRFWAENQHQGGSCAAVYFSNKKIYAENCETHLMFFCRKGDTYIFVNETKSWSDASSYCEDHYDHLATFRSYEMSDIFTEMDFPVWVGLHKQGGSFKWSSGNSVYTNWTGGEPRNNSDCVTIFSKTKLMATEYCNVRRPFVCMYEANSNVLLVKENKSWEEALEHCRNLSNSGLRYDLVSVQPGDEHERTMSKVMEADTEESVLITEPPTSVYFSGILSDGSKKVWTGLRFLGDEWLWVNGESTTYSDLPQCPIQEQRCGALSKNTSSLETRDCSERKNFLCYRFIF